jgi:hypothetical protein
MVSSSSSSARVSLRLAALLLQQQVQARRAFDGDVVV